MDNQRHKAHRPAQSGGKADKKDKGKGKEKQHGFNEKVCYQRDFACSKLIDVLGLCAKIRSQS